VLKYPNLLFAPSFPLKPCHGCSSCHYTALVKPVVCPERTATQPGVNFFGVSDHAATFMGAASVDGKAPRFPAYDRSHRARNVLSDCFPALQDQKWTVRAQCVALR